MNIWKFEVRQSLGTLVRWTVGLLATVFVFMIGMFPIYRDSISEVMDLLNAFPKAFLEMFGMNEAIFSYGGFFAFACTFLVLIGIMFSATVTISVFAREKRSWSMEFLFTKPITRTGIFNRKLLAVLFVLLVSNILLIAFTALVTSMAGESETMGKVLLAALSVFLTQLVLMPVMMLYAVSARKVRTVAAPAMAFAFEYEEFYQDKFHDYTPPAKVIYSNVEGIASYTALLFIPARPPYDYYSREFEKGLQLYSSGVLIMDKCGELLPDYFSFVKGLVDSQDLSLNISREMLQHDRQLRAIAERLEKKIKAELLDMQKNDREKYEEFFKNFGLQLKYGLYDKFGLHGDNLKDLILFVSSLEKKPVTLAEYISRMPEEQKYIYYAAAESVDKADNLPQTELLKDKGYEILYFTDDVDEFAIQALRAYEEKEFRSVSSGELDLLESDEEKKAAEEQAEASKEMLDYMKEHLGDKVAEVRLSARLKAHPVCLAAKGGVSLEMEKVLSAMPNQEGIKAERVLEINADHKIMEALKNAFESDKEKLDRYTDLLFDQAMLMAGFAPEDPVAFGNAICELMV